MFPVSEPLENQIDSTIAAALARQFRADPIVPAKYTNAVSAIGSVVKRHGAVIQAAVIERLRASPHHHVLDVGRLIIPPEADLLARTGALETCLRTSLPYDATAIGRVIVPDLVVIDRRTNVVTAYEIKRGSGHLDAGKRRATERDLLCAAMVLPSAVTQLGYEVSRPGRARAIFYYGCRSTDPRLGLVRADLDRHFGWPVRCYVDEVNELFRTRLAEALAERDSDWFADHDTNHPEPTVFAGHGVGAGLAVPPVAAHPAA